MKAGLAYEKKVKALLEKRFGASFHPGQWFCFAESERAKRRYCQVDGIVQMPDRAVLLVEVKINWTPFAWWQLRHLYAPVVQKAYGANDVRMLVITRSFDPAMPAPEDVEFQYDLSQYDLWPAKPVHVHLWRK